MSELPRGTITFLFTDIDGSTRLLQEAGPAYDTLLEAHRELLRNAFEKHSGYELGTEGDSFFVVFERASDAVAASVEGQLSLMKHPWEPGLEVRVRMGMHAGEARLSGHGYTGIAVHQASRISSAGHGGQVLISSSVKELAGEDLPPEVNLKDLGTYRLKDFAQPQRLFQLCHPDLPNDFPPLKSLTDRRNNLPVQLTSFIGRERELEELTKLAEGARLVTITGSGGSGKTRLALEVASLLLDQFEDGVWVVDLSSVVDPDQVLRRFATALGVREQEGRSIEDSVDDFLSAKQLLLVLDNCEHLVTASATLARRILGASPQSRILVTTREALRVPGEVAWRIPSLEVPDENETDETRLKDYEATRLFLQRASESDPSFTLDQSEILEIVQICRRLDGIPLAIELAAARTVSLSVGEIAQRLDDRFRLLTGGSNTALPRQQTLRALVDWSYGLLSELEREVLARASVFSGGFTLAAGEAVCSPGDSADVLDHLTALVNKSLLMFVRSGREGRYRLLETVRDYAREKLLASDSAIQTRDTHLDYFVAFAEEFEPKLLGREQKQWMDRLGAEHDNLRAALEWSTSRKQDTRGFRLVNAICRFWWIRGHWSEARLWIDKILASQPDEPSELRGRVLWAAAFLARFQGDLEDAEPLARQSLEMLKTVGAERWMAYPLLTLGYAESALARRTEAAEHVEESLRLGKKYADPQVTGWALLVSGILRTANGEQEEASALWEEALQMAKDAGDLWNEAMSYNNMGSLAWAGGDTDTARSLLLKALDIRRELDDKFGLAQNLLNLGVMAWEAEDNETADAYLREAAEVASRTGHGGMTARALSRLSGMLVERGEVDRAQALADEAFRVARSTQGDVVLADVLNTLAWFWHRAGRHDDALRWAGEAVGILGALEFAPIYSYALHTLAEVRRAVGDVDGAADALLEALHLPAGPEKADTIESAGRVMLSRGSFEEGARLFGASERLRQEARARLQLVSTFSDREKPAEAHEIERARAAAGDAFDTAWRQGREVSGEDAVALALELLRRR